ncbi:MAG: hypothetical protein WBE95_03570, partial [Trebonia sp.]|uniref:hypothetical protein n=1 Tax=Trebonia sp. TaxID=2767075 RepID=UPI003C753B8D
MFLGIGEQIVASADAGRATGEVHIGGATAGRDASCLHGSGRCHFGCQLATGSAGGSNAAFW